METKKNPWNPPPDHNSAPVRRALAQSVSAVGDGSIKIGSEGEKLNDFIEVGENIIVQPDGKKSMKDINIKGSTAPKDCKANEQCTITVTYEFDGSETKVVIGSGKKGKGLYIQSGIPFSLPGT